MSTVSGTDNLNRNSTPQLSVSTAWRNALGIIVLLWLVLGLANFGFLAQFLATHFRHQLLLASFLLDLGFAVGALVIVLAIVFWQRSHGETLADLGWRRPTTKKAMVIAVIFGLFWVASSYARGGSFLTLSWERPLMMLIGLFLAFGEELAIRGFFMENLRRGGIPTWVQVVSSAVLMGGYHGIIGLHYSVLYGISSAFLFGILSVIFVLGKRSLTPGYTAHAMVHFLGDPILTMGILHGVLAYH